MDQKLFENLVRENRSTIYTVCYMFSKDANEVADLFQEVLINIWKGIDRFEGRSNVKTWIYRISLNTCISFDRKRKKATKLEMSANFFTETDNDSRQVELLHKRISILQPFDRAIVLLWLESISYDEIGAIVGISAKNVAVRLTRIREQLKNMSND
ncbi:MAG: RNA polymerase sigma factor [Salinivirgaceae bacterium]|nr:RNA polymerase sigma factor [Salinivirgaceae bacterium]